MLAIPRRPAELRGPNLQPICARGQFPRERGRRFTRPRAIDIRQQALQAGRLGINFDPQLARRACGPDHELGLVQRPVPLARLADSPRIEERRRAGIVGPHVVAGPEPPPHALVQRKWTLAFEKIAPRDQPQLGKRRPVAERLPGEAGVGQPDDVNGLVRPASQCSQLPLAQLAQRQRPPAGRIDEVPGRVAIDIDPLCQSLDQISTTSWPPRIGRPWSPGPSETARPGMPKLSQACRKTRLYCWQNPPTGRPSRCSFRISVASQGG